MYVPHASFFVVCFFYRQVPSFGIATPPVTPPLSVASYHGSTTSVSSSNNNVSNSIDSHANSTSRRSSRRKRPRRKSLAGHVGSVGSSGNDNVAADYGERRYGELAPSFSSSLASPPYFCADDGSDGDSGDDAYGGDGKRPILRPPLLPSTKTKKSPPDDRPRRRRRRRCCCCRLSSRCLLVFSLCLMTAYLTFKVVWYFQWQARCVEGCYDPSMAKTGSRGPEQVCNLRTFRGARLCIVALAASSS